MEISPIGLRILPTQEYSAELTSGNYYSLSSPGPSQHVESDLFLHSMKCQQDLGGIEVMTAYPLAEGQNVCWRVVCPEIFQLIRIIGTVAKSEATAISGWTKVKVKPRLYNRHDLAAAEKMSGTPRLEFTLGQFRAAGA